MRVNVPADLLQRLDRPGPRYTSYPTVPAWTDEFGEDDWRAALQDLASQPDREVSVYVHLPYCLKRCHYCGCNAAIPDSRSDVDRYLDHLERELDLVAAQLGRRKVVQMHWGGGTPNYQTEAQLRRTFALLADRFDLVGEVSIECDPRAGKPDQPHLLRELGFNRISMGVQDFDPRVQEAIGRRQPEKVTRRFVDASREAGFESVNLDLVYGLPWAKSNQEAIDASTLPPGPVRFELYKQAVETLTEAGYTWIGLDHFARPDDELAVALGEKRLHRNFMGYTTRPALDMLAFGNSSIGDVCDRFAQNVIGVGDYEASVAAGRLPVVKGMRLSDDDRMRRSVILHLMCNLELPWDITVSGYGKTVEELIPGSAAALAPLADDGLITLDDAGLKVTDLGRFFLRNVAMVFDAYLQSGGDRPLYSRTV
jgi:oxygen-independent coproporphyrinogen-3 oxidase